MQYTKNELKHLFLQQSCIDAWDEYERQIKSEKAIVWDYVILTASNEEQAGIYNEQIKYRLDNGSLPKRTIYKVLPDPDGKRVGSGGATFNVLAWLAGQEGGSSKKIFKNKRILVIHSGGDSKRIPQYSVCGKLFSPVPRELPNGSPSTLFDEFMISTAMIAGRIQEGMLVMSGDVLLLFNALQIDSQFHGAAAISMKEQVSIGKDHGVFLNDGNDMVKCFLHKQTEKHLQEVGAVNEHGNVDLDTGAVIIDSDMLMSLFSLISTDGSVDDNKFEKFVNDRARVSFYGDFLYPLASDATLESYLMETPEGEFCKELEECRREIWKVLKEYSLKLLCLSPAEFIHFGTTRELIELVTESVDDYKFLGWKKDVCTNYKISEDAHYAIDNSLIDAGVKISEGSYIENSIIQSGCVVGENSIISDIDLGDKKIPSDVVMHGVKLAYNKFVVRIYGVNDNPKLKGDKAGIFESNIADVFSKYGIVKEDIWEDTGNDYLWFAKLYPVAESMSDAVEMALIVYKMFKMTASLSEVESWKKSERCSLYSSFNNADGSAILPWQEKIRNRILVEKFMTAVHAGHEVNDAFKVFVNGINEKQYNMLLKRAESSDFSDKLRIYYALANGIDARFGDYKAFSSEQLFDNCFGTISDTIYEYVEKKVALINPCKIAEKEVDVKLPVRVNWGGGWTDTPPYCLENGGVVLNAAIKLKGEFPIRVSVRKLDKYEVELESQDIGVHSVFKDISELQDCYNPYDQFALHKAALISCGIIPLETIKTLEEILKEIGGGIYLSTQVVGIPKGSGLGTSSILAGACVKGIFEFLGRNIADSDLYDIVLCMEQIMSTGGGWQDQVGGLTNGIKFITTKPGIQQKICVEQVNISKENLLELNERFALIYTGQRRLARNLLRDVVGSYIGGRKASVNALEEMSRVAALMRFELEYGTIDRFARLLNEHWKLSVQLDAGSTNTCIEQIFISCEDLIDGRFISGAGGGGFLQVILKKGVSKQMLYERLRSIFQDSGVDVWDCELI